MRFGRPDLFAIDVEIHSFSETGRPEGHICLWVDGERLGDYDEVEHLGVAQGVLADAIFCTGRRIDDYLTGKSAGEIIQMIKEELYDPNLEERTFEEIDDSAERYNKFVLCPGLGMAFDGLFVVLLDVDEKLQIIWSPFDDVSRFRELKLPRDVILGTMEQFCDWYETQTTNQ